MKRLAHALGILVILLLTACPIQNDPTVGEGPTGQDYPTGPTCTTAEEAPPWQQC